ncbi:MAG: hypothetical protein ACU83V_01010 [Gammaproteobacteria bacterium]
MKQQFAIYATTHYSSGKAIAFFYPLKMQAQSLTYAIAAGTSFLFYSTKRCSYEIPF